MKQVLQSLTNGQIEVEEVPPPALQPGCLLVRTRVSAISTGSERSTIEQVRQGLLGAAAQRPELVQQLFHQLAREGLGPAWQKVLSRLTQPIPLGYSSAGTVEEVGPGAETFQPGDPVACAGYGYASHAEVVCVPKTLCAKIPEGASWEEAAFTTLGAIAVQSVRVADLRLGENVAVLGLGIVGQLIVQAAHAAGCRVFGMDPRQERVAIAQEMGAQGGSPLTEPEALCKASRSFTEDRGFDAVILAAATEEEQPLQTAGELARDRGVIVVVGQMPLRVPRDRFYEKELSLRLARSYGPGRYDPAYEIRGSDYPFSYVRWTAQRNMAAFLRLVSAGKIRVSPLLTHRFPLEQARKAYELITSSPGAAHHLGVLLQYEGSAIPARPWATPSEEPRPAVAVGVGTIGVGLIGSGRFASSQLVPRLKKAPGVRLLSVATAHGPTAQAAARRFGIPSYTTDHRSLWKDPAIQAVVIATPHDLHGPMVREALQSGRHVFVEKPLCLTEEELSWIEKAYRSLKTPPVLMVGFNRRFSWASRFAKGRLENRRAPLTFLYRVNAGPGAKEGWLSDPERSGGRILGELGHFVDLATFLVGSPALQIFSAAPRTSPGQPGEETLVTTLSFADGSLGALLYVTDADRGLPKERIELFSDEQVIVVDDFRSVTVYAKGRTLSRRRPFQEKGFQGELQAFLEAIRAGGPPPIPFPELFSTTLATFKALESLRRGSPVPIQNLPDAAA